MAKRLQLPSINIEAEDRIAELESKVNLLIAVVNEFAQGINESLLGQIEVALPNVFLYLVDEE